MSNFKIVILGSVESEADAKKVAMVFLLQQLFGIACDRIESGKHADSPRQELVEAVDLLLKDLDRKELKEKLVENAKWC